MFAAITQWLGVQGSQHERKCCNEPDFWCDGPNENGATNWDNCEKNPGHHTFIPAWKFEIDDLPPNWRREDFVDFIKVWCDLTVRLRVKHMSPFRPTHGESCPCGPSFGNLGVGTGFVLRVGPRKKCSCKLCKCQPGSVHWSWEIHIGTANHVVHDEHEVENTRVDFYYDYLESRQDGTSQTLKGGRVVRTDGDKDWCHFTCYCHDSLLVEQMKEQLDKKEKLKMRLKEWWFIPSFGRRPQVIVAHPHGRPKMITVGELKGWNFSRDKYTYTADTCPGSSGAPVIGWWKWKYAAHHCQGENGDGLNKGFYSLG